MSLREETVLWDVIVIGGGPSGMMAAGRAGERGKKVLLLEKNDQLGKKLLITGGGRSNITNHELDTRTFLTKFSERASFLFSPFSQFSVTDTLDFFHRHGMDTILEPEGRVFPKTEKAETVRATLAAYMHSGNVHVRTHAKVAKITHDDAKVTGVLLADKTILRAKTVILATGGLSHPETGSTGDGFRFLKELGHTITTTNSALAPIRTRESWSHRCSGISFDNVKVTLFLEGKRVESKVGKLLFTHFGLSGPLILNMSKSVGERIREGATELAVDLFPALDLGALDRRIRDLCDLSPKKRIGNMLAELVPHAFAQEILLLLAYDPNEQANALTKERRMRIARSMKSLILTPIELLGREHAIVTSGGIPLEEVDMKTMRSTIYPHLFVTGDLLDINRPSGGYSLQLCWTTGWVAGSHAG